MSTHIHIRTHIHTATKLVQAITTMTFVAKEKLAVGKFYKYALFMAHRLFFVCIIDIFEALLTHVKASLPYL